MNLTDLLWPLDSVFQKCRIRYAVIGGYAVAAWGEERATRDIDLLCNAGHTKALLSALDGEHIRFKHRTGGYGDPIPEVIQIEMGPMTTPSEVDILIGIHEAPQGIFDRVRAVLVEGLAIPVVSPEDLIVLKLLAGSARDLEDARSVVQVQGEKLDRDLLRLICPERLADNLGKLLGA